METPSTFGAWLRQRRAALRLTRPELAQRVGCSVSALRKIEDGERRPSGQIAALLARGLGLPPDEHAAFVRVARGEWPVDRLAPPGPAAFGPHTATVTSPRPRLPVAPSPLIGRQREVAELRQTLRDPSCRALTLVGPGGIGKTRLALEAAAHVRGELADGIAFVPLAPITTPRLIVPLIAEALGFTFSAAAPADPQAQLFGFLREQQLLLILDNLEHLVGEPGMEVLAELLAHAPDVKLLATSRAALGLHAEWIYEVRGLPLAAPAGGAPDTAVALFLDRARRAQVGFAATPDDDASIVRICELVEGNPLAIELAATWVRTLTCAEIAAEIARGLGFLRVASHDLPARHRSLQAVFDHSWQLLGAAEQDDLRRLAVFRGGFRREAADAVGGVRVATLAALVAQSLLRRSGPGRYDLHELIRQFAAERLAEHPDEHHAARAHHGRYYLRLFAEADGRLRSRAQPEVLHELTAELENLRAAWEWALATGAFALIEGCLRTVILLFDMRGWLQEGYDLVCRAAAALEATGQDGSLPPEHQLALGHLLAARGMLAFRLGQSAEAQALLERSLGLLRALDAPRVLVEAITFLAIVVEQLGDYSRSAALFAEGMALATAAGDAWFAALCRMGLSDQAGIVEGTLAPEAAHAEAQAVVAAWRATGDPRLTALALHMLAWIAANLGHYDDARAALEESIGLVGSLGDRWGLGFAYRGLGSIAQAREAHHEAVALFRVSLETLHALGARQDVARVLAEQGRSVLALGSAAEAEQTWRAALRLATETQGMFIVLDALVGLAQLAAQRGEPERALELLEVVVSHPAATRETNLRAARLRDGLEAQLPPAQVAAARARSRATTVEAVVARILSGPPAEA